VHPFARLTAALDRQRSWLPVLLRVVAGATFIAHGHGKVFERGALAAARGWAERGIPLAEIAGPAVPFIEFVGGICLILGLGTRIWAFLQAWVMLFAIVFVHGKQGFVMHGVLREVNGNPAAGNAGWEWQALLLAACLTLAIGGPGTLALDALFRRTRPPV
jgi:putative oxidoreductase